MKKPKPAMARIVIDSRDASRDKEIPLALARELYEQGKLVLIDVGHGYPNSYVWRTK